MRTETLQGMTILVADGEGTPIGAHSIGELLTASFEHGARTVAVSVERLDLAFFELRSGVAGEIVQKLGQYQRRLAVVGELPPEALASSSFMAFVGEANRGDGPWFVPSLGELAQRLESRES
jgi:hypothetical protein